jgi:hypothetical protein
MKMPRRGAASTWIPITFAVLLGAAPASAQEIAAWVAASDRRTNPLVRELLLSPSLEARLEAAAALGERGDPYVEDLVEALVGRLHGPQSYAEELVLRVLLAAVFADSLPPARLQEALQANPRALELLAENLHLFGTPLARESYRLLGRLPEGRFRSALMAEGRRLAAALRQAEGRSDGEQSSRLVAYLEAVEEAGDPELVEGVLSILQWCRSEEVGARARRTVQALLPPP